jgi:hypothetical protein
MIVTIEREESDGISDATSKGNAILKAISERFDFNTLRVGNDDRIIHKVRVFVDDGDLPLQPVK